MVDLARHSAGECIALKDIARRQDIPLKYLEQIAAQLGKNGFVHSMRGPQGGYKLARSAAQCKVGDILRLFEGSLSPVVCIETALNPCPHAAACPTVGFWKGLHQVVTAYVDAVTLEDLARMPQ